MDALAKLNENFLSCNICTEIFKDPCTLGCYHTFCRACVTKYTKTRRDAISAKSILCPNCNQMTRVPRPKEPVDQWSQQFKPSFLIQGLLDTFSAQGNSDPVQNCCFTCQQMGKTTQAVSECEDCDILFCEACVKVHQATPVTSDHVISPLGAASTPQLKKRKEMCKEHNCLVEFCCRDCKKAVCNKCSIVYHRKCHSVVTLDSMIPEMKRVLQQDYDNIKSRLQQADTTLKSRRSAVEEIAQHKSSLQSEIRRVSQQAVDLIRRKEKKLLNDLDKLTEKQTGEVRGQIKCGEIDLQTYQQYTEFIKQVLQSKNPMDLYDMYTLCQSGEITAELQRNDRQGEKAHEVVFDNQLHVDQLDTILQLGHLKLKEDIANFQGSPKLLSKVSVKSKADREEPDPSGIEVLNIGGTETLVVADCKNLSVKSWYTKDNKPCCTSIKLDVSPHVLTKISGDRVAVSHWSHNRIELIKLTPDPVRTSSIKTKKQYRCLTALSDTTLAAGCTDPPSIDVLGLSGGVLRSVITTSRGQQRIGIPRYMCTTRQGHIVVTEDRSTIASGSGSLYCTCVTQQGEVLYRHELTEGTWLPGGVTTTDTGSVIVADINDNKIVQLTETGEYVRDLLSGRDGIVRPTGLRVYGNKLYVTELRREHVNIFQL